MTIADLFRLTPTGLVKSRNLYEFWQLLNVRERRELNTAQGADSAAIPMVQIANRVGELNREDPVAALCHTGMHSAVVAVRLLGQGFKTAANIEGGINAWLVEVDGVISRH